MSKSETYAKVYDKHRKFLNKRERSFWRAQLASVAVMAGGTFRQRLAHCLRVVFCLLLSGPLIVGGDPTFRRAVAGLIRWKPRKTDRAVHV